MSADVKGGGFTGSSMGGIGGYGGNRGATGMGSHLQSAGLGKITLFNASLFSYFSQKMEIYLYHLYP